MAFSRFPEEVWGLILATMEDLQDISNLVEAYPELIASTGVFKSKQNYWVFAMIFPHVFPWLTQKQVLTYRRVSHRWCQSVDHFLQNHSSRRAYDPVYQPWPSIPKIHSTFYPPLWGYQNARSCDLETNAGILLDSSEKVDGFLSRCSHPQGRNPFIGRLVKISEFRWPSSASNRGRWLYKSSQQWNSTIQLFEGYGAHIWYLDITRTDVRMPNEREWEPLTDTQVADMFIQPLSEKEIKMEFYELVIACLAHVPNLKSLLLKLRTRIHPDPEKQLEANPHMNVHLLPSLPHLETLEAIASDLPYELVSMLVQNYSSQIKRLSIEGFFWRESYCKLFPRLTEFRLLEQSFNSEEKISNLFLSLDAPQLCKLHLTLRNQGFVVEDRIILWLQRFPKLESLTLDIFNANYRYQIGSETSDIRVSDKKTCERDDENEAGKFSSKAAEGGSFSEAVVAPSLKHLWINYYAGGDEEILNCLRSFPSLETLTIYPKLRYSECFKHENMYELSLWESLKKLNRITILATGNIESASVGTSREYSREQYEFLKREVNLPLEM